MNCQFSTSFLCVQCFLFLVLLNIWPSLAIIQTDDFYSGCRIPFRCGNITASYPFWGGDRPKSCGHPDLLLQCDEHDATTIRLQSIDYYVLKVDERARTLKIVRSIDICQLPLGGVWFPTDSDGNFVYAFEAIDDFAFYYSAGYENLTVRFGCSFPTTHPGHVACGAYSTNGDVFLQTGANVSGACNYSTFVTVSTNLIRAAKGDPYKLVDAVYEGFEVKWKLSGSKCVECKDSGGSCGFRNYDLICHCPNLPSNLSDSVCANPHSAPPLSGSETRVLVGVLIILSILLISGVARKLVRYENNSMRKETIQNMEAFVRNFGSLLPQRFKYSDVMKMTKSFSSKLGQGGYGDVYKGKLADGRLVAVKLLKESKGNGEEFINEVASICRTSHVNIVTLLGFCYTRNKRALIYEFMSNGSLDNFIFDKEPSSTNHNLEWKTRYQIAIGIARGLEYLHRGCNTRIVHFDIKPHNILLDEDFCPKISDFGLAKLCKQKESVISMLGARGTAGYIAPEVFSRTFGEVSHKSDVYSYGMMVLEMVGGRKNIDVIVSHTSEIYFPNWIYKRLEPGQDFEFHGVVTEEEKEMAKKMIIVSMWCIQTIPSDRPSMGKVLEMLESSLESLQVPPKPSLSIPARSSKHSIPLSSFSTSTSSHKPCLAKRCGDK